MSEIPIDPTTKVATLLKHYPQLEEMLIEMAPPFKKLRNPVLRRSVAKVASLRQAAKVGRLPVGRVVNALRAAVGQPPIEVTDSAPEEPYLTDRPPWFDEARVVDSVDESSHPEDTMAITTLLRRGNKLRAGEIIELRTSFLPVPGIDIMRAKGFQTWSIEDAVDRFRTYFSHP